VPVLSNRALDNASDLERREREAIIAAIRARVTTGTSAVTCQSADCGLPIPEARRLAVPGCRFCINCQARLDRQLFPRRT